MTVAAVLLAAGRSHRFGGADKLAAPLGDLPLGLHAARALMTLSLTGRFVVTGASSLEWPGFDAVPNDLGEAGMSHSIALGVAAARRSGAGAVLIALADMPLVTAEHFQALLAHYRGPDSLVTSSNGADRMPPALFGGDWFDSLEALSGDRGARVILKRAVPVIADREQLLDIDTAEDLATARARLAG